MHLMSSGSGGSARRQGRQLVSSAAQHQARGAVPETGCLDRQLGAPGGSGDAQDKPEAEGLVMWQRQRHVSSGVAAENPRVCPEGFCTEL